MLELGLRNVFDAADAALLEVTLGGAFLCDKADPAADLADLLELGLRNVFDAADAARLLVTSLFLAIVNYLRLVFERAGYFSGRYVIKNNKCKQNEKSCEQ